MTPNFPAAAGSILAAMIITALLIRLMHPRTGKQNTLMLILVGILYAWARFWWACAVSTEYWYKRFREVNAELKAHVEATRNAG